MNSFILEKIGISNKVVEDWKGKGLKITYPVKQNKLNLRSDDGEVFVENADKYVPPLSKEEKKNYINNPYKFKEDLLDNTKFFRKFVDFIYQCQADLKKLKAKEKISSSLCLMYLFQNSMDNHYYHWDRYLVFENYPDTPVGYWWKKLKDLYIKVYKRGFSKKRPSEKFLKLISEDKEILKRFKKKLSKKDFFMMGKALRAIRIFEDAQQEEVTHLIDQNIREADVLVRTGFPIMQTFWRTIERDPQYIKKTHTHRLKKIKELHPIIAGRKLTLSATHNCFRMEILSDFKREINRWV